MSAETKRREILQMLAKGAINAEEASELLMQAEAVENAPQVEGEMIADKPAATPTEAGRPGRWLNVRVADMASGRNKVSVRIPLKLARFGLRMGARFAPEMEDMDWEEILDQLGSGDVETLVEVQDEEDGELVKIFVS